jgi:4-alpha-glucanotransferase
LADKNKKGFYHPRIFAADSLVYKRLKKGLQTAFKSLHDYFYFQKHDDFWAKEALKKLPAVRYASDMLVCGEDLGMVPKSVPAVLNNLHLLRLVVQRMPSKSSEDFAPIESAPYMSVCTPGSHDMSVLRSWWKEDAKVTRLFWKEVLGESGEPPAECDTALVSRIIDMHLHSPSMLAIVQLQDWLDLDETTMYKGNSDDERINIPAIMPYYWCYRMHLSVAELKSNDAFSIKLKDFIEASGR